MISDRARDPAEELVGEMMLRWHHLLRVGQTAELLADRSTLFLIPSWYPPGEPRREALAQQVRLGGWRVVGWAGWVIAARNRDQADPEPNAEPWSQSQLRRRAMTAPVLASHRCTAKSKQSRQQCRKPAISRGTVCTVHGGVARQVQRKARLRLAQLVDPAIAQLARELVSPTSGSVPGG